MDIARNDGILNLSFKKVLTLGAKYINLAIAKNENESRKLIWNSANDKYNNIDMTIIVNVKEFLIFGAKYINPAVAKNDN